MSAHTAGIEAELGPVGARLAARAREVNLAVGAVLLTHGESNGTLYYVVEGSLRATRPTRAGAVELGTVEAGSWLGEVGLIDQGPSTATVVAVAPSRLLALDHEGLGRMLDDDPELACAILRRVTRTLASRLRRTSAGVLEALDDKDVRLVQGATVGWVQRAMSWLGGGKES